MDECPGALEEWSRRPIRSRNCCRPGAKVTKARSTSSCRWSTPSCTGWRSAYMADERPGHTLQTTALVNEAYLRLVDSAHSNWEGRAHFFAVCARVMRRILVDWARSRQALKRGSDMPPLELDEALAAVGSPAPTWSPSMMP